MNYIQRLYVSDSVSLEQFDDEQIEPHKPNKIVLMNLRMVNEFDGELNKTADAQVPIQTQNTCWKLYVSFLIQILIFVIARALHCFATILKA